MVVNIQADVLGLSLTYLTVCLCFLGKASAELSFNRVYDTDRQAGCIRLSVCIHQLVECVPQVWNGLESFPQVSDACRTMHHLFLGFASLPLLLLFFSRRRSAVEVDGGQRASWAVAHSHQE